MPSRRTPLAAHPQEHKPLLQLERCPEICPEAASTAAPVGTDAPPSVRPVHTQAVDAWGANSNPPGHRPAVVRTPPTLGCLSTGAHTAALTSPTCPTPSCVPCPCRGHPRAPQLGHLPATPQASHIHPSCVNHRQCKFLSRWPFALGLPFSFCLYGQAVAIWVTLSAPFSGTPFPEHPTLLLWGSSWFSPRGLGLSEGTSACNSCPRQQVVSSCSLAAQPELWKEPATPKGVSTPQHFSAQLTAKGAHRTQPGWGQSRGPPGACSSWRQWGEGQPSQGHSKMVAGVASEPALCSPSRAASAVQAARQTRRRWHLHLLPWNGVSIFLLLLLLLPTSRLDSLVAMPGPRLVRG